MITLHNVDQLPLLLSWSSLKELAFLTKTDSVSRMTSDLNCNINSSYDKSLNFSLSLHPSLPPTEIYYIEISLLFYFLTYWRVIQFSGWNIYSACSNYSTLGFQFLAYPINNFVNCKLAMFFPQDVTCLVMH